MLFKRASRTDAEILKQVCYNAQGATLTANYAVVYDTGASVDGVRVTKAKTGSLQAFAGIVDQDIPAASFGLIQVYGYRAQVLVLRSAASGSAGANPLCTANDSWGLVPRGESATSKAFAFLCETVTSSAGTSTVFAKAFIRAL
jgi:hypothetical protein